MSNDPFREMATAMRSRQGFDGANVKFSKEGMWLAGKDDEVMDGAELIARVDDTMLGWILWLDKKPADYHVGFVRDNYVPPRRDQLGHTDKKRWRNGRDDPWELIFILPLIDANDGKIFIYSTKSQGGKDCLANLLDAYAYNKEQHPKDADKLPLVTLAADYYHHPSYGKVHVPILEINRWVERPANLKPIVPPASSTPLLIDDTGGGKLKPVESAGKLIESTAKEMKPSFGARVDMDDEIPF